MNKWVLNSYQIFSFIMAVNAYSSCLFPYLNSLYPKLSTKNLGIHIEKNQHTVLWDLVIFREIVLENTSVFWYPQHKCIYMVNSISCISIEICFTISWTWYIQNILLDAQAWSLISNKLVRVKKQNKTKTNWWGIIITYHYTNQPGVFDIITAVSEFPPAREYSTEAGYTSYSVRAWAYIGNTF